jgi:Ni/Co efflux regulator RcnB
MKKMAVSLLVATLFAAPLFAQEAGKSNPEQQHQKTSKHHHHKHDKKETSKSDANAAEKSGTMKDAQ